MSTVGTGGGRHHGLLAALAGMLMAAVLAASDVGALEAPVNDYPTVARADYIFGCMAANGQTRTSLEKCSCSIDVIASVLPYKAYEEAETIMSVRQRGGQNASMFISMPVLREKVARLKRAQIEGELRCF
ncbi:Lysyl-tRNA synthetase, class II [Bosea sp. LC85]|nr:Lysyl-tRNA synthetase, class II [Bosea sp. LC85]